MKPIWLLDVDGVLNAYEEAAPILRDWDDWQEFIARGFPIRYSPAMIARILALHESGAVEVRWLTTWGHFANEDLQPLGFPEFLVAAEMPFRDRLGWWKLPVAQDLFYQGRAVIWTDDEISNSPSTIEWMRQVADSQRANDLVMYSPPFGALSHRDIDDIEKWVADRANLSKETYE